MKRLFLFALPILGMLALSSCSSSDSPKGMADKCIKMADKAVTMEESPLLGELPSVSIRNSAAKDSLNRLSRRISEDLANSRAGMEEIKKFSDDVEEAKKLIDENYAGEFEKMSSKYIGLIVPCGRDERVFSEASAKITGFKGTGEAIVECTLTTASPIGRSLRAQFVDANNRLLMPYSLMCNPCGAETTFTVTTNVPVKVLGNTAHILFGIY